MDRDFILVDLFSGVGGFAKGLEQAGFHFTHHYFSEIDQKAVSVYRYHYRDAEYLGSVVDVSGEDIRRKHPSARIIVCFGFPCQDLSIAGKRKGLAEGTRSGLLNEAVRIVEEIRPDYFIAENVKGFYSSNSGMDFIIANQILSYLFSDSPQYTVEQFLCNTKWIIPQNRERTYFVGYPRERGFRQILPFGESDLKDLQEKAGRDLRERVQAGQNGVSRQSGEASTDIDGNVREPEHALHKVLNPKGKTVNQKVAGTLTAGGNSGGNHSDMTLLEVGTWRTHKDGEGFRKVQDKNCPTIPARAREDGSGQPVIEYKRTPLKFLDRNQKETDGDYAFTLDSCNTEGVEEIIQRGRGFNKGGSHKICPTISSNSFEQNNHLLSERRIRRLTETETERLQGFPENWTKYGLFFERPNRKDLLFREKNPDLWAYGTRMVNEPDVVLREISSTQRYKQMGNAVTTWVVTAVGEQILKDISKPPAFPAVP